jgi:hypothetical protein
LQISLIKSNISVSGLLNSNLMSFCSPVAQESQNLLKPIVTANKPCNLTMLKEDLLTCSPCAESPGTSTPFEGDRAEPKFTFENKLEDISEDPFDLVEMKAAQDANDPFEIVIAAAATQKNNSSAEESSKGSFLNVAFNEISGNSSTGLTADFEKLNLASGNIGLSQVEESAEEEKFANDDSNENKAKGTTSI